jgi:5-methyltetrahydrofolate--homocysteine methyltransferase
MDILKRLSEAVIEGKLAEIEQLTREAIEGKYEPLQIINQGLLPGMEVVGKRFKAEEMWIPEVLLSAKTMKTSVELLKPMLIGERTIGEAGRVVIGTVKGDLHDVGKNIVILLMEAAGFEVIDLGINVSKETFIETVKQKKPHVLGLSAMLSTTMMEMKVVIDFLKEQNLRGKVKVIVGGAPLNESFSNQIGADGYAEDAVAGVDLLKKLVNTN